ncbi:type I-E CRISPR-associated protein Cas6/Cse3/CasE [Kitasatospora sp. NPDC018058]|uniref:type I-E CRISPR-associated protein Cas6/Cse3/CasE n=1 Tax=Kitasatospora sp. NPDC018058 TaxID=3364025 RepID=UPI0037C058F9
MPQAGYGSMGDALRRIGSPEGRGRRNAARPGLGGADALPVAKAVLEGAGLKFGDKERIRNLTKVLLFAPEDAEAKLAEHLDAHRDEGVAWAGEFEALRHHPRYVKEWFAARLQPDSSDRVGPGGVRRIGADGDPDTMAIRMLPKLGLAAKHQGTKIGRAEIKGALTVTDPHAFVDALANGVGRARAYSAGLLLVRPPAGGEQR